MYSRRGWQYFYLVIAGFNILPIVGGFIYIPREPNRTLAENRRIDWVGAATITLALSLLSFAITQSGLESRGWGTPCTRING